MSAYPDSSGDLDPLVRAAEAAMLRSLVDPGHAMRAGRLVLESARRAGSAEAAVMSLRAMALAARELGDLEEAERHLREALGTPGAPPERLAQARLSLVTVRTERGHPLQALRVAALAWAYLRPLDRAKLDTQRAVALAHLGRHQEAIASCDRALRALVNAPGTIDDRRFLAGGLLNRGLIHSYRGDWNAAMRDLTACLEISRHAGLLHLSRLSAANLPFLAVRRGDIAGAFKHYREAEDTLFGFPERLATMRADFAGALLAAHLPGEARAMLSLAVPDLEAAGAQVALAEARLKLAQVELLTGDPRQARQVAEQAAADLAAQERTRWLPLAQEVVLRSRLALEPVTPALVGELIACADELENGFAPQAGAALRLVAAEAALDVDDHPTASAQLARLTRHAGRGERWVPAGTRLTPLGSEPQDRRLASQIPGPVRQHALALEAALQEDTTGAFRAVQDGLSEVSEQVETFDDPSLRAHAARAGERLAAFGLGLAVRDGSVEEVFEWSERWRAVTAPAHAGSPAGTERVRAQLGAGSLVEFVTHEESLLAVLISERRVLLRRLADIREVKESIVRLRYSLRRHARPGDVEAAAADVERLVLQPLLAELGNGPLVAVPVGALHTLPWGALPCLRERPVSVAASASAWMRARNLERALHDGPPVVVAAAGPSLAHAHAEVAHVLACHPGGRESPARTADVLRALRTADVLHLAAHGVFHARSPLVSGITLEDGPLMAYDLLEAPRSPELVVLSACNSGMSRAPVDGAPLGLPGTFLAKGASCVVAGLVPVRDEAARAMMGVFHELVVAGRSPDAALACAAAKTGEHAFVCFGAGDRALY
ncbi:CHAT domain-containing protein [Nonomuraea sp. KC401]|uniref:CHAT domain-containing protein n=1 Tax=unclassified Nonomuraea TaxID=2593643 RepID=UPI0010FDF44A|nr:MULTISPECIES: CHAT domain-containing tetratricopeptide repeat protein [unclassified Nonomuraea]NBE99372.1 CHAT domain-containing protein [Nonomuraea sp. K271]TLF52705.1 CHAT domain-containing protein [Nonomuraea sp. KC401]